jgi:hypothetical protein
MQNGYSLNLLVLNGQRNIWGENRFIEIQEPKSEMLSSSEMQINNPTLTGEMMPFVKIGNTFTVPFFRK